MALTLKVDKRLDVAVDGDTYNTVILGLLAADSSDTTKVFELVQTQALTEAGIAVRPYGLVVVPNKVGTTALTFVVKDVVSGATSTMTATQLQNITIGATIAVAGG